MRKLLLLMTTAVLMFLIACSGSFYDPGMDDSPGGGGPGGEGGGYSPPSGDGKSRVSSVSSQLVGKWYKAEYYDDGTVEYSSNYLEITSDGGVSLPMFPIEYDILNSSKLGASSGTIKYGNAILAMADMDPEQGSFSYAISGGIMTISSATSFFLNNGDYEKR